MFPTESLEMIAYNKENIIKLPQLRINSVGVSMLQLFNVLCSTHEIFLMFSNFLNFVRIHFFIKEMTNNKNSTQS